ncbi:MAG: NAD(FAD)-utilizing dehydrogenase [Candidatus Adlerbacteria bacterium]|nr:NAD(FAD)-utilizing dehydrogenase [Candidatus Adlerbacteria bacterium]
MHSMDKWDTIVIGGGAAGMMAAGRAASQGARVLVLEKNDKVGAKLSITGGGRCNITNAEFDHRAFLAHFGAAEQFLYSPTSQFGVQSTFDFFEKLGLPLVIEARKRAFPQTQKAPDVVKALKNYMKEGRVTIKTNVTVKRLLTEGGRIAGVECNDGTYTAHNYIVATGGASHQETGSTGDAFQWLKDIGHTVKAPNPTLVPLRVADSWVHKLSGTSLSFMKITFYSNGKKAFSKTGKLLFTHFGLSGPLILNSSYEVGELLEDGEVTAKIDMYPHTDLGSLEKNILSVIDANKNKDLVNVLDSMVPHGLDKTIASMLTLPDPHIKAHSTTVALRKQLVHLLKGAPLTVQGIMGFDRAIISDGGVMLNEIDTRTMQSLKYPNLYCTGDVLNINRPSGGYSLQLCWTTGFVAGTHAATQRAQ